MVATSTATPVPVTSSPPTPAEGPTVALCACGKCGLPVPLARKTNRQQGRVQGQPVRYRRGHAPRHRRDTLAERFWSKVAKYDGDGCWLWLAARDDKGYARIGIGRRPRPAARVVWELTYGPIPAGLEVCHRCDVRACVRPTHLFLGTHAENMADMHRKGRARGAPRGERHPRARLTADQVIEIRRLRWAGVSYRAIARNFGVAPITIRLILDHVTWKHLVEPMRDMSATANPQWAQEVA